MFVPCLKPLRLTLPSVPRNATMHACTGQLCNGHMVMFLLNTQDTAWPSCGGAVPQPIQGSPAGSALGLLTFSPRSLLEGTLQPGPVPLAHHPIKSGAEVECARSPSFQLAAAQSGTGSGRLPLTALPITDQNRKFAISWHYGAGPGICAAQVCHRPKPTWL